MQSRGSPAQDIVVLCVKFDVVFLEVGVQLIRAQDLGDLHQLVIVVVSVEKGFFSEDLGPSSEMCAAAQGNIHHGREHAPQTPHVQAVVVFLKVYQQLWALEIARSHPDVVFCLWVVKLSQTPVNET